MEKINEEERNLHKWQQRHVEVLKGDQLLHLWDLSKKACGGESIDRKLSQRAGRDLGRWYPQGRDGKQLTILGKSPGQMQCLKRVLICCTDCLHKELRLAARAQAWQSQGGFFFWLCHSPSLPSSVTGFGQKRWALCSVFLSLLRWDDKKVRLHGPVTGAESCVETRRAPFCDLSLTICVCEDRTRIWQSEDKDLPRFSQTLCHRRIQKG